MSPAVDPGEVGENGFGWYAEATEKASAVLEVLQVREDFGSEARHVGDIVGLADDPLRVDQVGSAQRVVGVRIVGSTYHLVIAADFSLDVGQQSISETLSVGEGLVFRRGVEGCTQDDAVGGSEFSGPVTQALALSRSA